MISELPQLEVLEVLNTRYPRFELLDISVAALSRLPKLRLVDLSMSLLWEYQSGHEAMHSNEYMPGYLPFRVVHHLLSLQRANPNIQWVLGSSLGHQP